jgi:hypothetical protein
MPWTGTVLYTADWSDSSGMPQITNTRKIAGKSMSESIAQPRWGTDDTLFFASDRSGFWQLFSLNSGNVKAIVLKDLQEADFAIAEWQLGR